MLQYIVHQKLKMLILKPFFFFFFIFHFFHFFHFFLLYLPYLFFSPNYFENLNIRLMLMSILVYFFYFLFILKKGKQINIKLLFYNLGPSKLVMDPNIFDLFVKYVSENLDFYISIEILLYFIYIYS